MIPTEGDNDTDATTMRLRRNKIERITPEQELMLEDKMKEAGVDPAKFLPPPMSPPQDHWQRISLLPCPALNERHRQRHQNPARRSIKRSEALADEIPY